MAIPTVTLTPTPRRDGAALVGDLGSMPDVADTTVVPLAQPIEKVANTQTTLPRGNR